MFFGARYSPRVEALRHYGEPAGDLAHPACAKTSYRRKRGAAASLTWAIFTPSPQMAQSGQAHPSRCVRRRRDPGLLNDAQDIGPAHRLDDPGKHQVPERAGPAVPRRGAALIAQDRAFILRAINQAVSRLHVHEATDETAA